MGATRAPSSSPEERGNLQSPFEAQSPGHASCAGYVGPSAWQPPKSQTPSRKAAVHKPIEGTVQAQQSTPSSRGRRDAPKTPFPDTTLKAGPSEKAAADLPCRDCPAQKPLSSHQPRWSLQRERGQECSGLFLPEEGMECPSFLWKDQGGVSGEHPPPQTQLSKQIYLYHLRVSIKHGRVFPPHSSRPGGPRHLPR